MHGMDVLPDTITFNTLIDGYYETRRIKEAEKLFSQIQGCGQLPDVQTYAILLDGLVKNQQLFMAMELFREKEGKKLELNIVICKYYY
ncbi:putative pentatricopeptide [Rosa chinensis]|uniref:Putative pentatricopeptide n=1 Tax=Rosa chinensis TaxID=74649 RepID=A0A2P6QA88_ROSCH|nr:putative pentatricopeptide [Rosa chinensis]